MNAFFTGWCLVGMLWCADTNDFGAAFWLFAAGAMLNGTAWLAKRQR